MNSSKVDWQKAKDGFSLRVPAGAAVERTLDVPFSAGAPTRLEVILENGARARLRVERRSQNAEAVLNAVLGEGASLDYLEADAPAERETCSSEAVFELGPRSELRSVTVALGRGTSRTKSSVHLKGKAASAQIFGLSLLEGEGQAFHETAALHEAPACTSRQFFKNILAGRARAEFQSLVSVSRGAVKSDSDQLARSLLLSPDARALTRPWLRIDADDVMCKHGASTGTLQSEELFYLKSRGLSDKAARFLIVHGFAQEVLDRVEDPTVKASWGEEARRALTRMLGD